MLKTKILLLLLLCFFCSCKNESSLSIKDKPSLTERSFDWLIGNWERANEKEGMQTLETWKKISSSEYRGFGFTMQNSDTIWQEDVKLILRDSIWNFEVTGKGENQPTIFKLIKIESEKFVSENQENDFPKMISYFRDEENLNAIISGGGQEIPFEFVPVEN